ncbi:MAG: cytochrome C oxidase subunit IV family protein [Bacteroidota bacterium]|nr:cytochrome C oxidase subunit IV family protein [Bacteroidota bacterium]MEE3037375.1 cytochrome C oxidase subunit IV family protein [Bacteroidota bacterium]|tara:strand:- start:98 stop:415 length:318 start_codon:yes stop_codon:yes gene_type:complete
MSEQTGTWWIWKVFWLLLIVTAIEVILGIIKPSVLIDNSFLGTSLLNLVFIILTIIKAAYIVMEFMHLGHEVKGLKWTILLPAVVLIPYLLFILLVEGNYIFGTL